MVNRQITAIVNFKPKQIANFMSECLVLGVEDSQGAIVLLKTASPTKNGTEIN